MGLPIHIVSPRPKVEARRRSALRVLGTLSRAKQIRPDVLHRARTDLRRLQAWFELIGDKRSAATLTARVSLLSPLRTLQVLEGWLIRHKAPRSDLRKVREASRELIGQLAKDRVFDTIRQTVNGLNDLGRYPDLARQRKVWNLHFNSCKPLLSTLRTNPKRKRLHKLRLELKQLRYQLEWVMAEAGRQEPLIGLLKQAQRCLGDYEDQAAFRKLAKRLDLRARPAIVKRWKRTRKIARALPQDIGWLPDSLRRLAGQKANRPSESRSSKRVNIDVTGH